MSYGSDHDPYDMVGVLSTVYMVHPHVNNSMHGCSVSHSVSLVGVVYATTETMTARRHMEYDLRQDPCVLLPASRHLVLHYYYLIC